MSEVALRLSACRAYLEGIERCSGQSGQWAERTVAPSSHCAVSGLLAEVGVVVAQ